MSQHGHKREECFLGNPDGQVPRHSIETGQAETSGQPLPGKEFSFLGVEPGTLSSQDLDKAFPAQTFFVAEGKEVDVGFMKGVNQDGILPYLDRSALRKYLEGQIHGWPELSSLRLVFFQKT
jgi:hypothetical protein